MDPQESYMYMEKQDVRKHCDVSKAIPNYCYVSRFYLLRKDDPAGWEKIYYETICITKITMIVNINLEDTTVDS